MKYMNYIRSIKIRKRTHNKKKINCYLNYIKIKFKGGYYIEKSKRRKSMNMKFIKGMIMGGIVSAGAMMVYKEMSGRNRKQMIKKGKQFAKKMGIL